MFASAHTGENATFVKRHFLLAFASLGVPNKIKTDNGPAYTSKQLKNFFQEWGIHHNTGIPHSPTGQSIVERSYQTLKRVLEQQKGGTETLSPVCRLSKALFVINFLNCSSVEPNPPIIRHFANSTQMKFTEKPPVLIKDPEDLRTPSANYMGKGICVCINPIRPKMAPC